METCISVENKSSDKKSHISKSRIPSSPTKQKSRYNMRDIPSASPLLRSAETRRARGGVTRAQGRHLHLDDDLKSGWPKRRVTVPPSARQACQAGAVASRQNLKEKKRRL